MCRAILTFYNGTVSPCITCAPFGTLWQVSIQAPCLPEGRSLPFRLARLYTPRCKEISGVSGEEPEASLISYP